MCYHTFIAKKIKMKIKLMEIGPIRRGMDGEGGRRRVLGSGTHEHSCLIHVNVWQKPPQYDKAISLQLKQIN